jgi:hypothetical protein
MAREGGQGFLKIYMLKGERRGRGLIFFWGWFNSFYLN